jgi:hypothetical protein
MYGARSRYDSNQAARGKEEYSSRQLKELRRLNDMLSRVEELPRQIDTFKTAYAEAKRNPSWPAPATTTAAPMGESLL